MECFFCRRVVESHGEKVKAVLCSNCVARLSPAPEPVAPIQRLSYEERKAKKEAKKAKKLEKLEKMKTAKRGKGRGWHLKKVFVFEGNYFSFGEPIDAATAAKLMKEEKQDEGKLEPTKAGTRKKVKRKKV